MERLRHALGWVAAYARLYLLLTACLIPAFVGVWLYLH